MKKLIVRALSGLVFVLVVCAFIFMAEFGHAALFLLVGIISLGEFYRALSNQGVKLSAPLGIIVGAMLYLVVTGMVLFNLSSLFLLLIVPLFMVVFLAHLWKKVAKPFESIAYTICGMVYVAIPLSLTILLAKPIFMDSEVVMSEYSPLTMLGILVLQWVSDSFAYLTGVCIGKHPLFPRHSPKTFAISPSLICFHCFGRLSYRYIFIHTLHCCGLDGDGCHGSRYRYTGRFGRIDVQAQYGYKRYRQYYTRTWWIVG